MAQTEGTRPLAEVTKGRTDAGNSRSPNLRGRSSERTVRSGNADEVREPALTELSFRIRFASDLGCEYLSSLPLPKSTSELIEFAWLAIHAGCPVTKEMAVRLHSSLYGIGNHLFVLSDSEEPDFDSTALVAGCMTAARKPKWASMLRSYIAKYFDGKTSGQMIVGAIQAFTATRDEDWKAKAISIPCDGSFRSVVGRCLMNEAIGTPMPSSSDHRLLLIPPESYMELRTFIGNQDVSPKSETQGTYLGGYDPIAEARTIYSIAATGRRLGLLDSLGW